MVKLIKTDIFEKLAISKYRDFSLFKTDSEENNLDKTKYDILINKILKEFKLNLNGDHGVKHWQNVYNNTQIISKHYNINSEVFRLFSLFHDSKRENEDEDLKHGKRAAVFIKELVLEGIICLEKEDLQKLTFACANHTRANKKAKLYNDPIVRICFDADRLDIYRVGIIPSVEYFYTDLAKDIVKSTKYLDL